MSPKRKRRFRSFFKDERGATAVEYALLVAMIALGLMGALSAIAGKLNGLFNFLGTFFS